ncbi:MAG TPA: type II CAAX endopeptidase family protein [Polyangiaceae bacterium]|nr:type II CAAX endopeptidase family protein [Polyangiaceae bacterium]
MTPVLEEHSPSPAAVASPTTSRGLLLLCAGLVITWTLLIRRFGGGDVYPVLGSFALGVVVAIAALRGPALAHALRPTTRAVLSGLLIGVGMTVATYPVFDMATRLVPGLRANVTELYRAAATRTVWQSMPWVLVIILAEEFLFRSALLDALERRMRPAVGMLLSIAAYTVAQAGTGSGIVALMALVCGAVWTLQRHYTKSLLSPLISHLIWTPVVILLKPVL